MRKKNKIVKNKRTNHTHIHIHTHTHTLLIRKSIRYLLKEVQRRTNENSRKQSKKQRKVPNNKEAKEDRDLPEMIIEHRFKDYKWNQGSKQQIQASVEQLERRAGAWFGIWNKNEEDKSWQYYGQQPTADSRLHLLHAKVGGENTNKFPLNSSQISIIMVEDWRLKAFQRASSQLFECIPKKSLMNTSRNGSKIVENGVKTEKTESWKLVDSNLLLMVGYPTAGSTLPFALEGLRRELEGKILNKTPPMSLSLQKNQSSKKDTPKRSRERGKIFFREVQERFDEMGAYSSIERERIKTNSDFKNPRGVFLGALFSCYIDVRG
ncbi:hypothetical protein M9H77_35657 [Catharanthus roseus]|uniref:Uncharacterized protein n=1 Tax=Catharanthus roseus TaxID=4058 RepID=A0ACB9ZTV7_CATRO|nr:hypothetical protein M9H77_35657 [Catharanthus roseus]